ncbi:MAG: hypothetical protein OXP08_03135 [bacterium]|nr:hypothetical protein [bacterium]
MTSVISGCNSTSSGSTNSLLLAMCASRIRSSRFVSTFVANSTENSRADSGSGVAAEMAGPPDV